jgi:hypothetical protein
MSTEGERVALRDIEHLRRMAAGHGSAIGVYAADLLDHPLPWTKMRQVYALLGLVKRWPERVGRFARDAERFATARSRPGPRMPRRRRRCGMSAPAPVISPELKALVRALKFGRCTDTLPERLALANSPDLSRAEFLELVLAAASISSLDDDRQAIATSTRRSAFPPLGA